MFQRDYLLRLLEQLQEALARILTRRKAGQAAEAASELDVVAEAAFGMSLALLVSLPEEHLLRTITHEHRPDFERLVLLVRLLHERAASDTTTVAGPPWARKALRLLAELGSRAPASAFTPHREALRELVTGIDRQGAGPALLHDLWLASEAAGAFDRAEDALDALAAHEPDTHASEGEAFYRRLLTRDDLELDAGGLPRDEVEDGLSRWLERGRPGS